jgi:hypothetical protein
MGCGCKKKTNQSFGNSQVTVQVNEGTNQIQQQVNFVGQHVDELINKIEQINDSLEESDAE